MENTKKEIKSLNQRHKDAKECLRELETEFYDIISTFKGTLQEALDLGIVEIKYL